MGEIVSKEEKNTVQLNKVLSHREKCFKENEKGEKLRGVSLHSMH